VRRRLGRLVCTCYCLVAACNSLQRRPPPAPRAQATRWVASGTGNAVIVGGCATATTRKSSRTRARTGHEPAALGPSGRRQAPKVPAGVSDRISSERSEQTTSRPGQPWGTSYTANLTPDKPTAWGWTADMFVKALKTGKHRAKGDRFFRPCRGRISRN
jgi:hypothetical protein